MEKQTVFEYWKMVVSKAWRGAWDKLGIWGIFFPGAAGLLASWFYHRPQSLAEMFGGELLTAVLFFILFYVVIVWIFVLRESSNLYYKQKGKLSLKEYDDISITPFEYPWTDNELRMGLLGVSNNFQLGLLVRTYAKLND